MEDLVYKPTELTPKVHFNAAGGELELRGRSIPENSKKLFEPMFDWVDNYIQNPPPKTHVILALEYFNTSSSKCILDFLKRFENINEKGISEVKIEWHYEYDDPQMLEAGENYQQMISIPIEMVSVDRIFNKEGE